MGTISIDLRKRIVAAYQAGKTKTYEATAEMFDVGRASVNRLLRRYRDTGDVKAKPRGGNRARVVDDVWLKAHAEAHPDARLIDRMAAWETHSGSKASYGAMWSAMKRIGWTHKKRHWSPASETRPSSKPAAKRSSTRKASSTRKG